MDPSRSPGDQFNDHVLPNIAKSTTEKNMASTVPVCEPPLSMGVCETPLSMGEILSSFDPGISFAAHGAELCVDKHPNKINGSQAYVKRSNFWGRNNVSHFDISFLGPLQCKSLCHMSFIILKESIGECEG